MFDNVKDMLMVLNTLIEFDKNGEFIDGKHGCIRSIIRIKNGFNDILEWKSYNDCNYCDVKYNIIVYDKLTEQNMICEVQFLLSWQLKAKKIGHKCYSGTPNIFFF